VEFLTIFLINLAIVMPSQDTLGGVDFTMGMSFIRGMQWGAFNTDLSAPLS
jgi:hypothetical protein